MTLSSIDPFTRSILYVAEKKIEHIDTYEGTEGKGPIYKGTLRQNKDDKRFTYVQVDDKFITKLTKVAQKYLDSGFQQAPYLPRGENGKSGAHISLSEGDIPPPRLSPKDEGKEVRFRLKPDIWEWNHEGTRLNGRILAIVVEILDGEGKEAIDNYGFYTFSAPHITFAMKKTSDKKDNCCLTM
jgi:hypothetical protein